ncbi:MAG: alkaline phosphatase, partial [Gemmatimonadetes bacterium]
MDSLLAWLTSLPIGTLYVALAAVAAIENVFPPIPADTVVALGSFLAARGKGSVIAAFTATWLGNVTSAMIMYGIGRRYGAARLE